MKFLSIIKIPFIPQSNKTETLNANILQEFSQFLDIFAVINLLCEALRNVTYLFGL